MSGTYRRHEPEKSALYGVVREHLETFLTEACEADGDGYPRFVEHEFRRYLDCGPLCHGFARLRCPECGYERLVAFSCKGKLCPSCLARRAGDTAAWLVDHLLPSADYRQWVLTFPWTMRFRLAADRQLLTELLGIFLRTLFAWQRRWGREHGIVAGPPPRGGAVGAVTFVQRWGGALNLNPHLHSVVPDGLFVAGSEDTRGASLSASGSTLTFLSLPPPTTAEVEALTTTVARRCTERLVAASEGGSDYLDPKLAALCEALFWSRNAPAATRDIPLLPGLDGASAEGSEGRAENGLRGKPLCASVAGFSCTRRSGWRRRIERLSSGCAGTGCGPRSPRSGSLGGRMGRWSTGYAGRGRTRREPPTSSWSHSTSSGASRLWCRSRTRTRFGTTVCLPTAAGIGSCCHRPHRHGTRRRPLPMPRVSWLTSRPTRRTSRRLPASRHLPPRPPVRTSLPGRDRRGRSFSGGSCRWTRSRVRAAPRGSRACRWWCLPF